CARHHMTTVVGYW
nr:immunoglobulin heavy chain junction region [Macaca mulatta]MOW20187.1 immunoglobulin heavy chain junction region [Macaca mulatta]MOW21235.1 immunoglobulin heavy chain junction region [Macaca mulatta]